ncbi:hypothetical protein BDY19DRAFT_988947 [Irpex rosettiformis]|uniref:Uncharacterized protein n=1 Tax=Irpex rosettiformis TaxID=378272 RepID=A0ACB8UNF1_9APHY|nr:hypothetical protein BDY19DRAFT_988947 [Irpex rosettiformis]
MSRLTPALNRKKTICICFSATRASALREPYCSSKQQALAPDIPQILTSFAVSHRRIIITKVQVNSNQLLPRAVFAKALVSPLLIVISNRGESGVLGTAAHGAIIALPSVIRPFTVFAERCNTNATQSSQFKPFS